MLRLGWLAAFATATLAFALDPQHAITQLVHTSWTEKDGAPGNARALAQTQDGYLWIGTTGGLFRFDGIRFTAFQPTTGESFPATRVQRLLATRDGSLWIVWAAGAVSRVQNGHVTSYLERDGLPATAALIESDGGTLIAGTAKGLSRFEHGIWKDTAKEWSFPGAQARQLYFDRAGTLWVLTEDKVVYLPRGGRTFVDSVEVKKFAYNFAQAPDGAIWVSETARSAHTIQLGSNEGPATEVRVGATWVLFDRDGSLWVGSVGDGLRRVPYPNRIRGKQIAQFGPETEQFTAKDGLSGALVVTMFEDREGNIWCATTIGLDRFQQGAFSTVAIPHPEVPRGVLASKDGSLWALPSNPVETIHIDPRGEMKAIGNYGSGGACEDDTGALWSLVGRADFNQVYRFRHGRFAPFPLSGDLRLMRIHAITCDHAGIWLFDLQQGLFHFTNRDLVKIAGVSDLSYRFPRLYVDSKGRAWLGLRDHIEIFDHGSSRRFGTSDGLSATIIKAFSEDKAGNVWVGGDGGLGRFDHDRFRRSSGLPAQTVIGLLEDDDGYWWIACESGVLRTRAEELEHSLSDPAYRVRYELFGVHDGLPGRPVEHLVLPVLAKTRDGRVWVSTAKGLAYVDPRRIPRNTLPPPVHVESVKVNRKEAIPVDGLALSHGSNDLEIDYTALSFAVPERVRFKYKLEGHDEDWQEVGTRREAYYGGLAPKHYRFRVIASNNDGVWNDAGATWDFRITPAYYQTIWFQALCALAACGLVWLLFRLWLRQVTHSLSIRMEERVHERTRIARELHDTLLQSFQGALMKFSTAAYMIPNRPVEARQTLEATIEEARQAIIEGRDAVQGLRASAALTKDIAQAIGMIGEQLAAQAAEHGPAFSINIEGKPQEMPPAVADEIYCIACEAIRNSFQHANATRIEVDFRFGQRTFQLLVRDNGKGIDAGILGAGGRYGHHGLPGMRERAEVVRGKLEFRSRCESGTEIELSIPASLAYSKSRRRLPWSFAVRES